MGLALLGLDFLTSISGAASAIANVGPGLGPIIGPEETMFLCLTPRNGFYLPACCLAAWKLFTVMVLFTRAFWRA